MRYFKLLDGSYASCDEDVGKGSTEISEAEFNEAMAKIMEEIESVRDVTTMNELVDMYKEYVKRRKAFRREFGHRWLEFLAKIALVDKESANEDTE